MCHVSRESLVLTFYVGLILCNSNKHILFIVFNSSYLTKGVPFKLCFLM